MPGIRRGRAYDVDCPTPGASKLIACRPRTASSRSNGALRSRLAPRPVMTSSGGPIPRTEVRSRIRSALMSANRMVGGWSGERAGTGDVPADDERLDGLGAFISVDGLDIGHVPHHVEVQQD